VFPSIIGTNGIMNQKSVTQPLSGLEFVKHSWEILTNEVVSGLMRRLQAY
jgi:hypothetical protein